MPSRALHGTILLLLIITLFSACSHRAGPRPDTIRTTPTSLSITGTFETEGLKGRLFILAREPDLIRVELYGAMNTLMLAVAGSTDRCSLYRDGEIDDCSWERSVIVAPVELVSIITARYHTLDGWKLHRGEDGRVTELVKYRWGSPVVVITIGGYRHVEKRLFPSGLIIRGGGRTLRLEFESIGVEPSIGVDMFQFGGFRMEVPPPSRPS